MSILILGGSFRLNHGISVGSANIIIITAAAK